jgi:hypothetical protein
MVPTRALWPVMLRICLSLETSKMRVSPRVVPTDRYVPRWLHATEHTMSLGERSTSFVTLHVHALHRYTHDPSPTASTFWLDQSTRFR